MTRPYDSLDDLPEAVKKLPEKAQEIWLAAFNAALKEYDGDEGKAAATAWAAVKKAGYETGEDEKAATPEQVRRFTLSERALSVDNARMVITAVLATPTLCADGWSLPASAMQLRRGDTVPLLWLHGYGAREEVPLGSVRNIRTEQLGDMPVLVGDKHYYRPSEALQHLGSDLVQMPAVVFDMRVQGHMRAVSAGFEVHDYEEMDETVKTAWGDNVPGKRATDWELLEVSDCPIGMDIHALDRFAKSLSERQRDWLIGRECRGCGQCQTPEAKQPDQQPGARSVWELLGELNRR